MNNNFFNSLYNYLPLILAQQGPQRLERTPEPQAISDEQDQVAQYNLVMHTKLAIAYALGLELIHRCQENNLTKKPLRALDLACGPGRFTHLLAEQFNFSTIEGRDLSPMMVARANQNARELKISDRLQFSQGDARTLNDLPSKHFNLTSFTDAAHHMPTLDDVHKVLQEMDRVTTTDGLVFMMDLVRLRTHSLTESYVKLVSTDEMKTQLPAYYNDFYYSMFAAWTSNELSTVIPKKSDRVWIQIVPQFLPTIQFIVGLPVGRSKLFLRQGFPWPATANPVPKKMQSEWQLARTSLMFANKKIYFPK